MARLLAQPAGPNAADLPDGLPDNDDGPSVSQSRHDCRYDDARMALGMAADLAQRIHYARIKVSSVFSGWLAPSSASASLSSYAPVQQRP
jgi:hypothetical protein